MGSPVPNDTQIARMRATVTASLPDRCSILRAQKTRNPGGGNAVIWTAVYTNVPVRYGPFRVPFLEQIEVGGTLVESRSRWEFTLPWDTDITVEDQLLITSGAAVGKTFQVASPRGPQTIFLYQYYLCELVL